MGEDQGARLCGVGEDELPIFDPKDWWDRWLAESEIKLKKRMWQISWATIKKEQRMQRQYTLEIRIDCLDKDKLDAFREVFRTLAQDVYANAEMLGGQCKPQMAVFSEDYFDGHSDIKLFEHRMKDGMEQLANAGDTSGEEALSDELIAAAIGDAPKA